ncbi:hypothetical protein BT96DRAFT_1025988 [Gymnopus androsaceus JB14]|uniref:Uncharacterized protein n=1 Tax=Gymnopus androsaceus JB14 TaxID=1447944 RepID=A0A6A4GND8_9AGAR|nr:hypothetical protein BT96DRAFT_1025988 [Gymnopus androsaceus JB14]
MATKDHAARPSKKARKAPSSASSESARSSLRSTASKVVTAIKHVSGKVKKVLRRSSSKVSSAPDVIEIPDGDSNGNGNGSAQALTQAERDQAEIDSLRPHWTSPVYSFFDSKVTVGYEDNRKYHIFKCAAHRCRGKGIVRCYLDKGDKSSTSNLRTHAVRCFGEDAVAAATKGASHSRPDGSIHAAFGRQGSQPISVTHRAHTNPQIRANLTH